jgi:hypothetical protein
MFNYEFLQICERNARGSLIARNSPRGVGARGHQLREKDEDYVRRLHKVRIMKITEVKVWLIFPRNSDVRLASVVACVSVIPTSPPRNPRFRLTKTARKTVRQPESVLDNINL